VLFGGVAGGLWDRAMSGSPSQASGAAGTITAADDGSMCCLGAGGLVATGAAEPTPRERRGAMALRLSSGDGMVVVGGWGGGPQPWREHCGGCIIAAVRPQASTASESSGAIACWA
jgi:hypothetical protein